MLGRPVARRLLKEGFAVRAMARNPELARAALPSDVEVVRGDLVDPGSIDGALQGCDAVYLTVETLPKAHFCPETDGLQNLVAVAKNQGRPRLMILSALRASFPECAHHPVTLRLFQVPMEFLSPVPACLDLSGEFLGPSLGVAEDD